MQAKSFASFESVENDVRTIALAASSTTEMSRVQSTSSVIASNPRLTVSPSPAASWSERHDDVPGRRDREARTWIDDQRRALFLDHRRPREAVADCEASAVVHGRLDEPAGLREPDGPPPLDGLLGSTAGAALEYNFTTRDGSAHGDTDVDELDRHVGRCERELLAIRRLEGRRERPSRGGRVSSVVGAVGQRDHQVEPLPQKAPVGEALEARGLELEAGIGHDGARLVLEGAERRLERCAIAAVKAGPDGGDPVYAGRRNQKAERRGNAGRRWADDLPQAELSSDVAGVDGPRAARTEQRVVARIPPAPRHAHAGGARHA